MKFDDLDRAMRVFETEHDVRVAPGVFMVARIDGRSFTRLTRERHAFSAPYDVRVRDMMVATTAHLMACGFSVVYGYTQSDEISLLMRLDETAFGRKQRKLVSILAGEASAKFSLLLGDLAAFDCRISELPTEARVVDYFRWRHEDAHRNALHGNCYWMLRAQGLGDREATGRLDGQTMERRRELLLENGIDFDALPAWQKRGVGLRWVNEPGKGVDPRSGAEVEVWRRRLAVEEVLPTGTEYSAYLRERIAEATASREP